MDLSWFHQQQMPHENPLLRIKVKLLEISPVLSYVVVAVE